MAVIKNIALMGTSMAVRLGAGMLTFVVMARMLGPDAFGVVMFWLSVSTLLGLIANYGFTPYLLKEIGARPHEANRVMGEVLGAKLLLSLAVLSASLVSLIWVGAEFRWVFLWLLGAILADSLTDFLNVGYRATNQFGIETRIATIASALQLAVIGSGVWMQPTALAAAFAFFVSRVLVLLVTWSGQRSYIAGVKPAGLRKAVEKIKETFSYATDFGFQSLFGQIDSVVIGYFVGVSAVGVYQAGMRIFMGGAQIATVLANVFLPRTAASANDALRFRNETSLVQKAFVITGAIFGLALALLSELITDMLFGEQFKSLSHLLPWFGLLFFIRFFAASWGIVLTSAGLQGFRAWANLLQWIGVLILAMLALPRFGTVGWLGALIAGNAALGIAYLIRGLNVVRPGVAPLLLALVGCAAFVPCVRMPVFLTQ